jgi:hypothetical protein
MRKAGHHADGLPRLLREAGLESTEPTVEQHPVLGGVAYYVATKPLR